MTKSQIDTFVHQNLTNLKCIRVSLLCVSFCSKKSQMMPSTSKTYQNSCQLFGTFWVRAVDLTTRLRRVIGCLQTPVLGCGSASGGFFRQTNLSENLIICNCEKKVHLCFFRRKLMKYAPLPPPPYPHHTPPSQ